jgi:hypothetical protein
MKPEEFDRLSRHLGAGASRRAMLKAFFAGIAGMTVASVASRSSLADDRCNYPNQTFCGNVTGTNNLGQPYTEPICCDPNQTCIPGNGSNAQCCDPNAPICGAVCCRSACCGGVCCGDPGFSQCVNGQCSSCPEGQYACSGACCATGDICLDGACCAQAAICFLAEPPYQSCCAGGTCLGSVEGEQVCCPQSQVCEEVCCGSGQSCAGGQCCASEQTCGTVCCPQGDNCIDGHCCIDGGDWCGDKCCPYGEVCDPEGKCVPRSYVPVRGASEPGTVPVPPASESPSPRVSPTPAPSSTPGPEPARPTPTPTPR